MSFGGKLQFRAPYSRHVMRALLPNGEVGPGSRVLVAGCGDGQLVAFLTYLGMDAVGIDRCPEKIQAARRIYPVATFHQGEPADFEFTEEPPFDLLIVQDVDQLDQDLFSREALTGVAHLMATLSPGGHYACLLRRQSDLSVAHSEECLVAQLSYFPGVVRATAESRVSSEWIFGRRRTSVEAARIVRMTLPLNSIAHSDWLSIAEIAAGNQVRACCPSAMEKMASSTAISRAA